MVSIYQGFIATWPPMNNESHKSIIEISFNFPFKFSSKKISTEKWKIIMSTKRKVPFKKSWQWNIPQYKKDCPEHTYILFCIF